MAGAGTDAYVLAAYLGISPATIRSWANRGLIQRVGRDTRGRTLYDPAEVTVCAARHDTPQEPTSRTLSEASATVAAREKSAQKARQ